jgi:hypothetical protein
MPSLCTWLLNSHMHSASMQYGEFRGGFDKDKEDTRLVFYGVRYLVENYVSRRWTMEDIEKAAVFHRCMPTSCMQGVPPRHSARVT